MSDVDTLDKVKQMGLSYITGLPAASQLTLLGQIHEDCPDLFDETLTEFSGDNRQYILCRHHQKGYRRELQNHRNLRKVYESLKKIQASPQNSQKEKLFHRAMKTLEKYNQTKCWEISFQTFKDKKDKSRYRLEFRLNRQKFRAQNVIGHYYLLQTDLSGKELTAREAQQYYKKLIKAERHNRWDETTKQVKVQRLHGHRDVNVAGTWSESGLPYHGRSHGRVETE